MATIDTPPPVDWRAVQALLLALFIGFLIGFAATADEQALGASTATPPGGPIESLSGRRFYPTGHAPLDVALSQVGVRERGTSNRGPEVDRYLASVGISTGAPWCAAFTSWCRQRAGARLGVAFGPFDQAGAPWYSAVATSHFRFGGKISAAEVWRGARAVPVGSLVIWRRGTGWQGHIGFVWKDDDPTDEGFAAGDRSPEARAWRHRCGVAVEGNTSSGDGGSQRDGGGVYTRERCFSHSYFKIDGFVPVRPR